MLVSEALKLVETRVLSEALLFGKWLLLVDGLLLCGALKFNEGSLLGETL